MTLKTKNVYSSLTSKGFKKIRSSKHVFIGLYVDGVFLGIKTMLSHGNKTISKKLMKKIAAQLGMPDIDYFKNYVDCTITLEEYLEHLEKEGRIKKVSK